MKRHYIVLLISLLATCSFGAAAREKADSLETTSSRGLTIYAEELEGKTLGDIRNMLTGVIPGLEVTEASGGLMNNNSYETFHVSSSEITLKYRGSGSMTFILDGMQLPYNAYALDLSQVESITLVGDVVEMAKYGPLTSTGAIVIKTKSGGFNQEMSIKVNAEAGIAMTGQVAEYADGVDYALLNNQARANAGYTQLYSPLAIQGYLRGDAYDKQYPNVDYRSLIMGEAMPVSNVSMSVNGGSDRIKYSASVAELYSGDIVKTDVGQDYNQINISTNVTSKLNRFMSVNAGFNSMLAFRRSGRVAWNDWQNVPPVAYPVILGKNESEDVGDDLAGMTIYGTTANWTGNYYALLAEGGFKTQRSRSGMMFSSVDFDFSEWVPGLKSKTYVAYSTFLATTVSKNNDYLAYYWDAAAEDGMGVISPSHQGVKASGKSISSSGANQLLQFSERLSWDWAKNGHKVGLGASTMMYSASMQGVGYYRRFMQGILDARYSYRNKYVVDGVLQYVGSSRFDRDSRFKPFAAGGAAWIVSNEDFMKNVSWIDKLKIRGQYGVVGMYESAYGTQYLYESHYSRANGYVYGPTLTLDTWFGNKQWQSQKTTVTQLANPDLSWGSQTMWDAGLDFDFCDGFSFMFTAYGNTTNGEIADVTSAVPALFGISSTSVYANYTSTSITGYEATLNYRHTFGDFGFNAGVSVFHWDEIYNKLVTDDYLYPYQKKTGTSTSSIWGFECLGKYTSEEQIASEPAYSAPVIGDLRYKDQNGDGKIDTNDKVILGSTQPKFRYSVNLGFSYKNFDFQAVGTGRFGGLYSCTGDYFWSGWGDGNYTAFVRDNIGGDYPRLSYVKSTNNFVASDFWLRKCDWFKIQDVCLSYTLPLKGDGAVKGLTFSIKGQNLATFTNFKYLDPEAPSAGYSAYPLFRTITAGARINF